MLNNLQDLDPIAFLDIDTSTYSPNEIIKLKEELMEAMGRYVILKMASSLNEKQLSYISEDMDGRKLFAYLSQIDPNINATIIKELNNFKADYTQTK